MKWISIVILCFVTHASRSQSFLVLKKRNHVKAVYEVGDKIKIRLTGEKFYTHQMITGFGEDMIRFHYFDIPLEQIAEIKLTNKTARGFNFGAFSSKLIQVSIGYLMIDQFNQVVIRDEPAGISQSTAIVSGAFMASALLLKVFDKKRFKLKNAKFRLEISNYIP